MSSPIDDDARKRKKPLARNLGEFFGHIVRAIKSDAAPVRGKTTVRKTVEEEDRGDVVLRRTTIDEVEIKRDAENHG